jgi:hypothetical protein
MPEVVRWIVDALGQDNVLDEPALAAVLGTLVDNNTLTSRFVLTGRLAISQGDIPLEWPLAINGRRTVRAVAIFVFVQLPLHTGHLRVDWHRRVCWRGWRRGWSGFNSSIRCI